MSVIVEAIVAILQVASILILLYGLSLTLDNGLEKAITRVAKLRKSNVKHAKIDVLPHAA